ncbi:hypothetical protein [Sulfurimonas sp.]|uniref:hypothetical protein n=1 Tax=Sulfurimonas sp. TaxID=2022749 RepID=UPI003D0EE22F
MAGLILVGLLALGGIILVVMLITKQGKKRVGIFSGGYFIVIASFMLYTNYTCGPNSTDVKIMTPQAEAISNYILKNGLPASSLSEIPDLPYKLHECKKEIQFTDQNLQTMKDKNLADHIIKNEECFFSSNDSNYLIQSSVIEKFKANKYAYSTLKFYSNENKTGMDYIYIYNANKMQWEYKKFLNDTNRNPRIYDNKTSGICNTLRM